MSRRLEEVSSRAYPSLERKKGKKDNWVEAVGGLPSYIERIAKHLHYGKGHPISSAIAMAVNTVKRWATGTNHNGSKLKPQTVAKAAKAVAEWTAKKGRANAKRLKEAHGGIIASPDELNDLLAKEMSRLTLLEGVRDTLTDDPRRLAVANAQSLFGARSSLDLSEASQPADPAEVEELIERLDAEVDELAPFIEMLGGDLSEARGEKKKLPPPKPGKGDEKPDATRSKHLQRRLSSLGFDAKDDGAFGPKTEAEVKQFQHLAGLKEDGVVGPKTTEALKKAPAPQDMEDPEDAAPAGATPAPGSASPAAPTPPAANGADAARDAVGDLSKGMGVGDEPDANVRMLQLEMEELGYPNIDVDGRFGPKTEKSVKSFQKKMGLKGDGVVGPKTKRTMKGLAAKLNEAVDRRQAAAPADFPAARAREIEIRRQIEEGTSKADASDPRPWMKKKGEKKDSAKPKGEGMKRCPSCGFKVAKGKTKCPKCGAAQRKKGDAKLDSD